MSQPSSPNAPIVVWSLPLRVFHWLLVATVAFALFAGLVAPRSWLSFHRGTGYAVVACAVRKDEHLARYGVAALDPYMLSLDILVERFCFEIGRVGTGVIVAEKRDAVLDSQLELAWLNLKIQDTRHMPAHSIRDRVQGLTTRHKRDNVAGLQLADLIVSPIGRRVIGKPVREDYRIIEQKLRGWPRNHAGMGQASVRSNTDYILLSPPPPPAPDAARLPWRQL